MNVTQQGNRLSIAFRYDLRLIEIVKTLPDRTFNHKQLPGVWSVPATPFHCQQVIEKLTPIGFYIDSKVEQCADTKAERPKLRRLPKSLFPYQKEAVEFTEAGRGRVIIGDAPGVGKSAPALVWVNMFGGDKILIVAPANVTWKWAEKEIALWAIGRTWQVIEGSKTPIKRDVDITIMSYRTMVLRYEELSNMPFDAVIFDEAHALKSNKSQQNRVARKLVKGVPYLLFLTGTAFKNKRFEMFQLLHMLDPKVWNNAIEFGTRYCGGQFHQGHWITPPNGETNTEELQARLAPIMLRRTKMQVANDLPDLTRVSIPITIDNIKEYETTLRSVKEQARQEAYKPARALTLLNTLRQVVGKGKVKAAIELAEDLLESGEQVALFAHHKAVVEELKAALWQHKVGVISGDTKPKDRQALANAFLAGQLRVMVISSAGKEGLDLYSASHMIFVERLWTPADEEQIEARLHRNGQKNAVTAHYLIAKGTVDQRLDEIVRSKRAEFANLIESDIIREVFMELV